MANKPIHLEMLPNFTSAAFIAALKRFLDTRELIDYLC
jgi:hypothetical protein